LKDKTLFLKKGSLIQSEAALFRVYISVSQHHSCSAVPPSKTAAMASHARKIVENVKAGTLHSKTRNLKLHCVCGY